MDKENRYTVEKASEGSRWSMTFTPTVVEAHSYIGSVEHWRITDHLTNKVVAQSEGELPAIFDKGKEPREEVKTYKQTEVRKLK